MANQPHRTEELQQASFLIILAVVTLLMAVIIWPFAQPLLWAGLAAIMFQPLYRNVLRRMRGRRNPAAGVSLLVIVFVVMVPALWVATMVAQQAIVLVTTLQRQPVDLAALFDRVYGALPKAAQDAIDRSGLADMASVQTRLQELLTESAGMIASQAVSIGSGALSFFLSFGVALYVMYFLLRDGERIGRTVLRAVPPATAQITVYLPHGTSPAEAAALRHAGWCTLAGLAPETDIISEARRMECTHYFVPDQGTEPVALD